MLGFRHCIVAPESDNLRRAAVFAGRRLSARRERDEVMNRGGCANARAVAFGLVVTLCPLGSLFEPASAQAGATPPYATPISTDAGCIIQSDLGSGEHKNFETVVLQGHDLVHYWHDNSLAANLWNRGQVITRAATGRGCIIQSDFANGDHGNFEVVVPEGGDLVHYWHDNSDVNSEWRRGGIIARVVTGPAAIIQSDFAAGDHGNFEVVALQGTFLNLYWHDNSDVNSEWRPGGTITTDATSGASIIQSDFGSGDHGNFEVVVREGDNLVHYWRDNSNVESGWRRGGTISTTPGGPAAIIQSDFGSGGHGNFEVVTVENGQLVHYWHDNSDVNSPWRPGGIITAPAGGFPGLVQSDFGSGDHGNFEVVVFANDRVTHHWHDNSDVNRQWALAQDVTAIGRSQKVCQLTGDFEFENRNSTRSRTATRFSVGGTDLGYPFEHDGRLYLAFGDTYTGDNGEADSLAYTRDAEPESCPYLEFVADGDEFRPVGAPGISMAFFEVPTTGFSANGAMYIFVWTNHASLGNDQFSDPIGHAALLRSDNDGRDFRVIWEHLGENLVYLSAAIVDGADVPGLPPGQNLLMWGSGRMYRGSNPYLAYVPLQEVEDRNAVRFLADVVSRAGDPIWTEQNSLARPLFDHPCIGELSVTWNRNLRQWLMLYNCHDPNRIVGRASYTPWGPWSDEAVLFSAEFDGGFCRFIHRDDECGPLDDEASPSAGGGDVYAPFVIPRYTRGGPQTTTIYYAMSTWNPYQVVLMRSTLAAPHPFPNGPDTCQAGYVWRETIPDDHVCVPPATRDAARAQNALADQNRSPAGGPYGQDTCLQGFVWREAFVGDHVCVTPDVRSQTWQDNALAASRRVQ